MPGVVRFGRAVSLAAICAGLTVPVSSAPVAGSHDPPARLDGGNGEATVTLQFLRASPSALTVPTGTTVIWHNAEPLPYPAVGAEHELEADDGSFASPPILRGNRWSFRFGAPGEFTYRCRIHATLRGTVVAEGEPAPERVEVAIVEPDHADPDTWGYDPEDLAVETGTVVTWRNLGATEHTVTADDGSFDSGDMDPGETWTRTFEEAGVFRYHCAPHPWMTAVVRVTEPGRDPPSEAEEPAPGERDERAAPAPPPRPNLTRAATEGPARDDAAIVEPPEGGVGAWGYDPPSLNIAAGDSVAWVNEGAFVHTVTADDGSFDSGELASGDRWERAFDQPGTYTYHCAPHPWMRGRIRVAAAPDQDVSPEREAIPAGSDASAPGGPRPPVADPRPAVREEAGVGHPVQDPVGPSTPSIVAAALLLALTAVALLRGRRSRQARSP